MTPFEEGSPGDLAITAGAELNLVWSMGKVASSSLLRSLQEAHLPVAHLHNLEPARLQRMSRRLPSDYVNKCRAVARTIPHWPQMRVRIVSAVRDPVARNLSAYFQNMTRIAGDIAAGESDRHMERFLSDYAHNVVLNWFDYEFLPVLGFDIFAEPFAKQTGYQFYRRGAVDILVLRSDISDADKSAALSRLFGRDINLVSANIGGQKSYAPTYAAVRRRMADHKDYLERMYCSKFARHFWPESALQKFRDSWTLNEAAT